MACWKPATRFFFLPRLLSVLGSGDWVDCVYMGFAELRIRVEDGFFCQVQGAMIKRHASADSSSTRQCHGSHLPCHNNAMQQGAAKNGVGVQENIEVISRANSELKQERHLRSHVNVRMTEQWSMLEGELSA